MVWHIKRRCSELRCEKGSWNDSMKFKKSMTTVLTYKETKIGTLYLTLKQTKLSMLDFEYYPLKPGIDLYC